MKKLLLYNILQKTINICVYIQFSEKDRDILGIIGQVLVSISLVCMVLIILIYSCKNDVITISSYCLLVHTDYP